MIKNIIIIVLFLQNIYGLDFKHINRSLLSIGASDSQTIQNSISPYKKSVSYLYNRYNQTKTEYEKIQEKFISSSIPPYFALIPYAESKFKTNINGKGVAGLWQLSGVTARNFGLTINQNIDERKDLDKSTDASIKLILHLKKEFKEWYLVDFAYAMGEGTLRKLIKQSGTDIDKLLENPNFPKGTKAHFAKTIMLDSLINQTDINTTNIE